MKFVGVLLFSLFFQGAFASDQCSSTLKASSFYQTEVQTETIPQFELSERFVAYLKSLHQAGALPLNELITLQSEFRSGATQFSLGRELGHDLVLSAHMPMLTEYLDSTSLDRNILIEELDVYIEFAGKNSNERGKVSDETIWAFAKMEFGRLDFHPVKYSKAFNKARRSKLKHAISLASTPVTQAQWVDVMGENPSYYKDGPEVINTTINGTSVQLLPDHPVENLTVWSMMEFANRMSIRDGFEPAYLINYERFEGRAEDGTLAPKSEYLVDRVLMPLGRLSKLPIRKLVKVNHIFLNVHKTQGYRLPSDSEWNFITTNGAEVDHPRELVSASNSHISHQLGGSKGIMSIFDEDQIDFTKTGTATVADRIENFTTKDGQKIYDLFGNVEAAVTTQNINSRDFYFRRMGWNFSARLDKIRKASIYFPGFESDILHSESSFKVGFRLVRTLLKEEAQQ